MNLHLTSRATARHFITCAVAALLLVVAPGCDSSSDDDGGGGGGGKGFSATITGSRSGSYSGTAIAVESHDSETDIGWGIIMSGGSGSGFQIIIAREGVTPTPGTYQIAESPTPGQVEVLIMITAILDQYHATSGTLTITSSSSTVVVGSFSFEATYGGLDTNLKDTTIMVNGTFNSNNHIDDGSSN